MGCPPVRGDNPRALASGLSYVQVDKHAITILYHLHQCRHAHHEIFCAKDGKGGIKETITPCYKIFESTIHYGFISDAWFTQSWLLYSDCILSFVYVSFVCMCSKGYHELVCDPDIAWSYTGGSRGGSGGSLDTPSTIYLKYPIKID